MAITSYRKTQLQVGENINKIPWREKGWTKEIHGMSPIYWWLYFIVIILYVINVHLAP